MKLYFIASLVFAMNISASVYSQQTKMTLQKNRITVQEVLDHIENNSEYRFILQNEEVDTRRRINANFKDKSVEFILNKVFEGQEIKYDISEKDLILIQNIKAQDNGKIVVKGVVSDESGETVPGVSVTEKGTFNGVITNERGEYSLKVGKNSKIEYSFVGLETQIVDVQGRNVINIILKEKANELDEVTVVAFGKQKKESVIASVQTIRPKELKIPSSNLTNSLAGRMSGIISYQRSGEPGQDNAEFFIRGVTTFGYKKSPLILIDNVELGVDDLSRLNPDDIESFSIMKDATATALYGARGANGVILVMTKEGSEGKAKFNVRFENSFSMPTQELDIADPIRFMELHNESIRTRDPLGNLPYTQSKIDNTKKGGNPYVYPQNDWYGMLFKDYTSNQRLNFSVSGGGKIARYYVAGTASKDSGILESISANSFDNNIDLRKYVLRSNVNINVTPTTELIVRLHMTMDDYQGPLDGGSDLYAKVMHSNPVRFPAYFEPDEKNKSAKHILFGNDGKGNYINPYAEMLKGYKESSSSLMLAQIELKQKLDFITKGLNFRLLANSNRKAYFENKRQYKPFYYKVGAYYPQEDKYILSVLNEDDGTEYLDYDDNGGKKDITSSLYMESALSYNRDFFKKHNVSGLLVYTMRETKYANAGTLQKSLPFRNMGLSGRFTYAYDSRYFGEFNFGYNGSERFSQDERFGFFPSAGLGWMVSNEGFFENAKKYITKFKLKATYGLVGNDAIGTNSDRFFYLSEVTLNSGGRGYNFGYNFQESRPGVDVIRYANDKITWEQAIKQNYGVEIDLFDKFVFQGDLFFEKRENILMNRASIPNTMGLASVVRANVGEAKSKGFDCSLDFNHSFSKDFWISGRSNFTYAVSEFTKYEEPHYDEVGLDYLLHTGYNLNQSWGLVAERLFIDEEDINNSPKQTFGEYMAGDIKYKDINGDGKISNLDRVPIGYPTTPEIVYGFGMSAGYKIFDFSFFLQGSARSSFFIEPSVISPFNDWGTGTTQLLSEIEKSHWSENNRDIYAFWPRLSPYQNANNNQRSTWWMRDGSFIRLKSMELGLSLPENLCKRYNISKLRFYVSGSNLLTFSKFDLWDVEMGYKAFNYPIQKVYNLGLQLNF